MDPHPIRHANSNIRHRRDLLVADHTDTEIYGALAAGQLIRVAPGAFVLPSDVADVPALTMARIKAVAERSPTMPISHLSAAFVHGLPLLDGPPAVVHQIRAGRGGTNRTRDRSVHTGPFSDSDVQVSDGVLLTTVARTLTDLGRTLPFEGAVAAVDHALHRQLVELDRLAEALERARSGRGAGAAARAVFFADGRCESVGESRLRVVLALRGLPSPELQLEVLDGAGRLIGRSDLGYPELGVLIEFDGLLKYDDNPTSGQKGKDALVAEKRREDALRELGWTVVRVTWADLRHPERVAQRVRRALELGRRTVAREGLSGAVRLSPRIVLPG